MQHPHPVDHRYYPDVLDENEIIEVDGDANILDGIDVILTNPIITSFCNHSHPIEQYRISKAPYIALHFLLTYNAVFTIFAQVILKRGHLGKIKQKLDRYWAMTQANDADVLSLSLNTVLNRK